MPFYRSKIAKSFVLSLNETPDSAAIVHAIISLGASLNLPITAEGVEDAGIEERLRVLGCAKAQGWHYGRPLSVASVRRLLAERRLLQHVPASPEPAEVTAGQRRAG